MMMIILPYLCVYAYKIRAMYFVHHLILDVCESNRLYVCLVRTWFVDLTWSDSCDPSCVFVCVFIYSFGSVTLTLYPILLLATTETTEFAPESKEELQDAVMEC